MVNTAGTVLQTVALSLPAVALYMTVLNELYMRVEKAEEPISREGPTMVKVPKAPGEDDDILRGFVTMTRSMNGLDFRLATVSLFFFVVSALLLVFFLAVGVNNIRLMGMGAAVLGFVVLALALAYTTYASLYKQYPQS